MVSCARSARVRLQLAKVETTGSVAEKRLLEEVKSQNPHATRAEWALIFTVRRCQSALAAHLWTLGHESMGRDVRLHCPDTAATRLWRCTFGA